MSFLEKRLGSLAGDALSKISDKSPWRRKNGDHDNSNRSASRRHRQDIDESITRDDETYALREPTPAGLDSSRGIGFVTGTNRVGPFSSGILFGGDSTTAQRLSLPPEFGFRTDLLAADKSQGDDGPVRSVSSDKRQESRANDKPTSQASSSDSLYRGDFRKSSWFLRLFILCLVRLLLFISKVYQDFRATKFYSASGLTGHFMISAATLLLPTVVFTLYRVSRYLQVSLPQMRATSVRSPEIRGSKLELEPLRQVVGQQVAAVRPASPSQAEDEGLVTARQTPTVPEETFHDSQSTTQQSGSSAALNEPSVSASAPVVEDGADQVEEPSTRPPPPAETSDGPQPERPQRARDRQVCLRAQLESPGAAHVDKLGALPDKETARVAIGTSEQLLHGVLFIFWQLKRQVDVLSYLVERACIWRAPSERECLDIDRLRLGSDGLEWFQDFYAAFLAIMTQVYSIGLFWSSDNGQSKTTTGGALGATASSMSESTSSSGASNSVGRLLAAHANQSFEAKDLIVFGQLIVSLAVVASLLIAVRRLDDGPLTFCLSSLGWGALFFARIVIIALAFVHLGWRLMLALVALHVLVVALWIYKIALDSHNDRPSERQHEAIWDDELEAEAEGAGAKAAATADEVGPQQQATDEWSSIEHLVLLTQIFALFAVPSLFFWPIMFNLKLHSRPFKYLLIILSQNCLLILAIWHSLAAPIVGQLYLLGAVGALSIAGFVFVSLYVACKPQLTEYFVRADLEANSNQLAQAGVYYEFCSRVFKMPDLQKRSFKRLTNQREQEQIVDDEHDDWNEGQQGGA